jgi:hypothetical protein
MTLRYLALLIVSLFSLAAGAASAADVPASGEKQLKDMILKTLYRHKEAYEKAGGTFGIEGDFQVERTASYYAVTLPKIIVTDAAGTRGDIGMIALNATPGEKPGTWKMSVALPTPILYSAADGTPRTRIELGQQKISGVWHEKLGQFITLSAAFNNVTIDDIATNARTVLSDLTVTSDLKETRPDYWSGTVLALAKNIETRQGKNPASSKIAHAKITADVTDLTANDAPAPAKAETEETLPTWYDMIGVKAAAVKTQTEFKGLSMNLPGMGGHPATTMSLDQFALGLDLANVQAKNPSVGLTLAVKNLAASPETEDFKNFAPRQMNVNVTLEKLPLGELTQFAQKTFLSGTATTPAARQIMGLQAMLLLPQIFSHAGTAITIKDTFVTNGTYNGVIEGAIAASDVSTIGMTGKIKAQLGGLDALQAALTQRLSTANNADKPSIEDALKKLAFIASLGRDGQGVDGKKALLYDFNIDDTGTMTLNGKDAATLLFGGGKEAQKPSPKADTPKPNSGKPAP